MPIVLACRTGGSRRDRAYVRSCDSDLRLAAPEAEDRRRPLCQTRESHTHGRLQGPVTATRGNHGQSVAVAAARNGIPAIVIVPEGNSVEKNAAMEAFGAELMVAGTDFDESRIVAERGASERGFHLVPSFHREIVRGVATYAHEIFTSVSDLAVVYVPIGMGSGICGLITVRDLLGLTTEI